MVNIDEKLKEYKPNENKFYEELNKKIDFYNSAFNNKKKNEAKIIAYKILMMYLLMLKMNKKYQRASADIENSLNHIKYIFYEDDILTNKEYNKVLKELDDSQDDIQIVNILNLISEKKEITDNPDYVDSSSSPVPRHSNVQKIESDCPEEFEAFGNLVVSKLFEEDILIQENMYNLDKILSK